jgi:hypothetical protein
MSRIPVVMPVARNFSRTSLGLSKSSGNLSITHSDLNCLVPLSYSGGGGGESVVPAESDDALAAHIAFQNGRVSAANIHHYQAIEHV